MAQHSLAGMLRYVRAEITRLGEWRPVIDALRPHTRTLWQQLSIGDQTRFLSRLLSIWNVRRHRMAPHIAAILDEEMQSGKLRIIAAKHTKVTLQEQQLHVCIQTREQEHRFAPSRIINCSGSELRLHRSTNALVKHALSDQVIEPHANGVGIAVDPHNRAWGAAYPHLHIIGSWMTGQWLESTAVPELRVQAQEIARNIASSEPHA